MWPTPSHLSATRVLYLYLTPQRWNTRWMIYSLCPENIPLFITICNNKSNSYISAWISSNIKVHSVDLKISSIGPHYNKKETGSSAIKSIRTRDYLPQSRLEHRQFCPHRLQLHESPLQQCHIGLLDHGEHRLFHLRHSCRFNWRYDFLKWSSSSSPS